MSNDFTGQADLQLIRYSQVWEDHAVLTGALRVSNEDDVLSICSAGCNALALLLEGPRSVTALDVSAAQAALLSLKIAAIEHLPLSGLLELLGVEPGDALARYGELRPALPEEARAYFDPRPDLLREGIVHAGRLERYFRGFQREHLLRLHPPEVVARLLAFDDPAEQARYFDEVVATEPFRQAFIAYFGQENLQSRGRDPAQFRYVSAADIGAEFLRRLRALIGRTPLGHSPYMTYFFTGHLPGEAHRPSYLQPEGFARLRPLLPRLRVVVEDLGAFLQREPPGAFSKANLSDIFEYMSEEDCAGLLGALAARMRRGGRLAYWNLLVPRSSEGRPVPGLRHLSEDAARLHETDRVFFYESLHIEEIVAP